MFPCQAKKSHIVTQPRLFHYDAAINIDTELIHSAPLCVTVYHFQVLYAVNCEGRGKIVLRGSGLGLAS